MRPVFPALLLSCLTLLGAACAENAPASPVPWQDVLEQPAAWYGTPEAESIAAKVLLFQTPDGGWPKNRDMTRDPEPNPDPGVGSHEDITLPTIDNGATTTQLIFLGRVYAFKPSDRIREALDRGIDYLLAAQYPNGGYPQFFPLRKGYYSRITFNDNAMVSALEVLRDVAQARAPFSGMDSARRERARIAVERGIACILACQVKVKERLTVWCAQHDEVTLAPAPARKYEHVSLSGSESVGIVRFLMSVPKPDARVTTSVHAAIVWFQSAALRGIRIERVPAPQTKKGFDRRVVEDPGAPPLWARFYEIGTNRPIFGGRDGEIHYRLDEVELERRAGYSWYVDSPAKLLTKEYPAWCKRWGLAPEVQP